MKIPFRLSTAILVLALMVGARLACADEREGEHAGHHGTHQYYRYHDHPDFGRHVADFYPDEYYRISVGGTRYYYDEGIYYDYVNGAYVVVRPPVGAIVSTIPSDFQMLVINGTRYYTDNGIYYVYTPNGYQVVSPPVAQAVPVTVNTLMVNTR